MLKHYELQEMIGDMVLELSSHNSDHWDKPPFIHTNYERLSPTEMLANFVELSEYHGFFDNKYKITIEYLGKEHEDYEKIQSWEE